jgi:hypothetical protein
MPLIVSEVSPVPPEATPKPVPVAMAETGIEVKVLDDPDMLLPVTVAVLVSERMFAPTDGTARFEPPEALIWSMSLRTPVEASAAVVERRASKTNNFFILFSP